MIPLQILLLLTLVLFLLGIIFPSNWFDIATFISGTCFLLGLFISTIFSIIENLIK
jgi:hypothetical protein